MPSSDEPLAGVVDYARNESSVKDKLPELVAAWRSGQGPLPKDAAAFMLLHHTSTSAARLDACVPVAAATCLAMMQDVSIKADRRSAAAALFLQLCKTETQQEALLRTRASSKSAAQVLLALSVARCGHAEVRECCARGLHLLTQDSTLSQVCIQSSLCKGANKHALPHDDTLR